MGSIYQGSLQISIFGQSHSETIGVVIDGLPAGKKIDTEALNAFLQRRAPGRNAFSTSRKEADEPVFVSGLRQGMTCGAPVCALIYNHNTRSSDYSELADKPRPGHADYTAFVKYGSAHDIRGGGHFSGRLTAPLCIAGGICLQLLEEEGITVGAHVLSVHGVGEERFDPVHLNAETLRQLAQNEFPTLNGEKGEAMCEEIAKAKGELDSVGGVIECAAVGLPAGLGEPVFDGMENRISRAVFAIPAIKGIEFGAGFAVSEMTGSQNNDPFFYDEMGKVCTRTNHHGGILGGITSGMPLVFRCAVKPTPSIFRTQQTVSLSQKTDCELTVQGRHDPCIAVRAVPCVISAAAIALYDALLESKKGKN
ncbi:MAG: chorismate synthase [Clostridia bacterium]|nr:chorismate synthase [Clostridia bacterium]